MSARIASSSPASPSAASTSRSALSSVDQVGELVERVRAPRPGRVRAAPPRAGGGRLARRRRSSPRSPRASSRPTGAAPRRRRQLRPRAPPARRPPSSRHGSPPRRPPPRAPRRPPRRALPMRRRDDARAAPARSCSSASRAWIARHSPGGVRSCTTAAISGWLKRSRAALADEHVGGERRLESTGRAHRRLDGLERRLRERGDEPERRARVRRELPDAAGEQPPDVGRGLRPGRPDELQRHQRVAATRRLQTGERGRRHQLPVRAWTSRPSAPTSSGPNASMSA